MDWHSPSLVRYLKFLNEDPHVDGAVFFTNKAIISDLMVMTLSRQRTLSVGKVILYRARR